MLARTSGHTVSGPMAGAYEARPYPDPITPR